MKEKGFKIDTPNGEGVIDKIYISELGYMMVKVYYPESKTWVNYNLGDYKGLIKID